MTTLNIPMPREQVERVVRQVVREQFATRLANPHIGRPTIGKLIRREREQGLFVEGGK